MVIVAKSSYLFILILIFIYDFVLHYIVLCCLQMYLDNNVNIKYVASGID